MLQVLLLGKSFHCPFFLRDNNCLYCLSPFFGGALAKPSERFPNYFGAQLWFDHPYLLSCLVAAFICIVSFGFTLVLLKEVNCLPSVFILA